MGSLFGGGGSPSVPDYTPPPAPQVDYTPPPPPPPPPANPPAANPPSLANASAAGAAARAAAATAGKNPAKSIAGFSGTVNTSPTGTLGSGTTTTTKSLLGEA